MAKLEDTIQAATSLSIGSELSALRQQDGLQSIAAPPSAEECVWTLVSASVADSTKRAYRQDLADFLQWGGQIPSSEGDVARFLAQRSETLAVSTLERRIVGISRAHQSAGHPDPTKSELVQRVMLGIRRTRGCLQRQVAPLLREDLSDFLSCLNGPTAARDRALILLGFAGAFRRSELVSLDIEDISRVSEGIVVLVKRSKTDQVGEGRKVAIPWARSQLCAVKALDNWLAALGIADGPIFRPISKAGRVFDRRLSAQSVALILKRTADAAGHDASHFSGHSLRAGLVTSAVKAGAPMHKIMQQTGHRTLDMLMRYIRDASAFDENAAGLVL